jgi:hypothetical protein
MGQNGSLPEVQFCCDPVCSSNSMRAVSQSQPGNPRRQPEASMANRRTSASKISNIVKEKDKVYIIKNGQITEHTVADLANNHSPTIQSSVDAKPVNDVGVEEVEGGDMPPARIWENMSRYFTTWHLGMSTASAYVVSVHESYCA